MRSINFAMLAKAFSNLPMPSEAGEVRKVHIMDYAEFNDVPVLSDENKDPEDKTYNTVQFIVVKYTFSGRTYLEWEVMI